MAKGIREKIRLVSSAGTPSMPSNW